MGPWVYLVIAIAVLAIVLIVSLVVGLGRRTPPAAPSAPAPDVVVPPPADADVAEPAIEQPVEVAPALERPEGTASRLVRLRQRLAGSQGGLGRGLLALLSRDRLDEDTWESIEDVLITADIGVTPTQDLVERLRTRMRVEGASAGDPKQVLREELVALVDPSMDRRLQVSGGEGKPGV